MLKTSSLNLQALEVSSARLNEKVIAPARSVGIVVPTLGFGPEPRGSRHLQSKDGEYWTLTDYKVDPTAMSRGGMPIPPENAAILRKLLEAGVNPDRLITLHQMDLDWKPGDPFPETPKSRRALAREAKIAEHSRAVLTATTLAPLAAGGAVVAGAVAAPLLLAGGLDPAIIAGVRHPGDVDLMGFAVLTQWRW